MVSGPDDLPGRRDADPDSHFSYTPAFAVELTALIPDETRRSYFTRDGIEFRLAHGIELQQVTPEQGYLITEEHIADMPECIIWFTIGVADDGRPLYTLDRIAVRRTLPDDEDDS